MNTMHSHDERASVGTRRWSGAAKIAFGGFAVVALYFLLTEHRAHFIVFLPFLLLAACPLLHMFHHGGHGDHAGPGGAGEGAAPGPSDHAGHGSPTKDEGKSS